MRPEVSPTPDQSSVQRTESVPRELAIATVILAAIMMVTGLALWFVASAVDQPTNTGPGGSVAATERLLETLTDELGDPINEDDLELAVAGWLAERTAPQPSRQVAAALVGGS